MCPWPLLQMMLCKTETKCWDRRDGRKRDSNMKTQQPPQIAGLLHRVVVQGDDFVLSSLPKLLAGLAVVDGLVDVGIVSW